MTKTGVNDGKGASEPEAERVHLDPCGRGDAGPLTCLAQRLRPGHPCEHSARGNEEAIRTAEAVRITAQVSDG